MLGELFAGLNRSQSAGLFEIFLGQTSLEPASVQIAPRHEGADVRRIQFDDGRQILKRLLWTVQFEQHVAAQEKGLFLLGQPAFWGVRIQEFLEGRQRLMPLLGLSLTASLRCIESDQPLPRNIKKWIQSQGPFIAKCRFVRPFQPRLDVAFPYPGPQILVIQLYGLVEIRAGVLDMSRIAACIAALGICDGHEAQVRLASDDQGFGGVWIELNSIGGELYFLPEVRSLKRSFEMLFGAYYRLWLSAGLNHEHADTSRLLLEFFQLSAEVLVFLLKLSKMFRYLSLRLKPANGICQVV